MKYNDYRAGRKELSSQMLCDILPLQIKNMEVNLWQMYV